MEALHARAIRELGKELLFGFLEFLKRGCLFKTPNYNIDIAAPVKYFLRNLTGQAKRHKIRKKVAFQ